MQESVRIAEEVSHIFLYFLIKDDFTGGGLYFSSGIHSNFKTSFPPSPSVCLSLLFSLKISDIESRISALTVAGLNVAPCVHLTRKRDQKQTNQVPEHYVVFKNTLGKSCLFLYNGVE